VFAAATWKKTIGLYLEIQGQIVTAFDEGALIDYCLAMEEADERLKQLKTATQDFEVLRAAAKRTKQTVENFSTWTHMWELVNTKEQTLLKLDARLDQKRKFILSLRQNLYLLPRSRAGVAPTEKEQKEDDDPMSRLLDN
jgi:hypothetical protein